MPSQPCPQPHRLTLPAEHVQLATQCLDTRCPRTAHNRPQITAQQAFDALDGRLLQECQTEQLREDLLDAKAHHAGQPVDLRRQLEQAHHLERRIKERQPQIAAGHLLARLQPRQPRCGAGLHGRRLS